MSAKHLLLAIGIICIPLAAIAVNAQKPIVLKGGEFCEGYLLRKVAKGQGGAGRIARLKAFNADDEALPRELREWLQTSVHIDMLAAFQIRRKEKKALILRASVAGATGIAANFNNWYVQLDGHPVKFLSLAENPRLIFWGKDGMLNYYSVTYAEGFAVNKDWGNVAFDLQRYRVSANGESHLVGEERNVKCK